MRALLTTILALGLAAGCMPVGKTDPLSASGSWSPPRPQGEAGREVAEEEEDDDGPMPTDPAILAKAKGVRILQNESSGCEAEALGPVDVHKKMQSTEQALDALKVRAAALGAEAVIGVEFEHGEGGEAVTHLSGMAVRCRDLLAGRPYDVIGTIKVEGKMGREHEAFAELRAKARSMRADLVLGVKFEHGEQESTTLTGTAIRLRRR